MKGFSNIFISEVGIDVNMAMTACGVGRKTDMTIKFDSIIKLSIAVKIGKIYRTQWENIKSK